MIRTQLQAVSTTTGAGKLFAQLPINIVIRHMANSLLYIAGLSGCFLFPFSRGDDSSGVIFGSLLFGFRFCFAGSA
ncbi:TPA: hypothetical protein QH673_003884 [Klebsiella aerogenes]|nr:hypothetical protein [Klebsiella aerogenes]HDS8276465.1 hypothetical protein [Klebsiella aerogenes]HDT4462087.1 hypothetical protein [Klebsiella aerogenes]